jgi:HTH-type transcriptional regulator/antitoxin MqsA
MTKKSVGKKAAIPGRRLRAVAGDACPMCGTTMVEKQGRLRLPLNGEEVAIADALHLRCPKCQEIVLRYRDARRLGDDAIAIYRREHGLLPANEIRAIRERFGLAQAEFARLLRLGTNTLSRWELGRNVQTPAMDTLLRLIRDLPAASTTCGTRLMTRRLRRVRSSVRLRAR